MVSALNTYADEASKKHNLICFFEIDVLDIQTHWYNTQSKATLAHG